MVNFLEGYTYCNGFLRSFYDDVRKNLRISCLRSSSQNKLAADTTIYPEE